MTYHRDRNHLPRELLCRVLLKLAAGATTESLSNRWFEAVVSLANSNTKYWNRLIIPIYSNLKQSGGLEQLPVVERSVIQNKFMQLLVLQIRQQSWLNKTISELIANEIPVILLKGAAAIGTIYNPQYARLSQDVDLLIKKKDQVKFNKAIESMVTSRTADKDRIFSERLRHEKNIQFNTEMEYNIEPHTGLHPSFYFRIDYTDLWAKSCRHPLYQSDFIRILSNEHALVYTATHSFFHLEFEPHHLVDSIRLIERGNPDIKKVYQIAKSWKCVTVLTALFKQMNFWFGYPRPFVFQKAAEKKLQLLGDRFHDPMKPSWQDPSLKDQVFATVLHDSYARVLGFAGYYLFKRFLDLTASILQVTIKKNID